MLSVLRKAKQAVRWLCWRMARAGALQVLRIATRGRVVAGSCAGLQLAARDVFGAAGAKLLGTYEAELTPQLARISALAPQVFVDVGGADGYFAVGLARQWQCKVIVFESLAGAREVIACNAALNNISVSIDLRGDCDEPGLHALLEQQATPGFLLMEVEGAVLDLISARVAHALRAWQVLIESHDFARPGCLQALERRLSPAHRLQRIRSRPRGLDDFPLHLLLPDTHKLQLMDEERPGVMTWLVAQPRSESQQ
jgi:hypothetical protein